MAREVKRRTVVDKLKSSDEDEVLKGVGLKLKVKEKREIDEMINKINKEQDPETKATFVLFMRKAIKLMYKALEKKNFEDI